MWSRSRCVTTIWRTSSAPESELLDLVGGGFLLAEDGSEEVAQRSDPPGGVRAVVRAEAGVDQHQAAVGLDE